MYKFSTLQQSIKSLSSSYCFTLKVEILFSRRSRFVVEDGYSQFKCIWFLWMLLYSTVSCTFNNVHFKYISKYFIGKNPKIIFVLCSPLFLLERHFNRFNRFWCASDIQNQIMWIRHLMFVFFSFYYLYRPHALT